MADLTRFSTGYRLAGPETIPRRTLRHVMPERIGQEFHMIHRTLVRARLYAAQSVASLELAKTARSRNMRRAYLRLARLDAKNAKRYAAVYAGARECWPQDDFRARLLAKVVA